jgi:hypothetical protein
MAHLLSFVTRHVRLGAARVSTLLLTAAVMCLGSACGRSDDGPAAAQCLPEPTTACMPDINTDFDSLYRNLFSKRCGTAGNACHGTDGHQAGLVLANVDAAYKALLGQDGTHARVIPGDPDCSSLMERLESDDISFRMPYMDVKLAEGSRCAVRMWIQDGAAR